MIVVTTILVLIAVPVLWIMLAPVNIIVNTISDKYQVRQAGTMTARFYPGRIPFMELKILGFRVDMHKRATKEVAVKKATPKSKKRFTRPPDAWFHLVKGMLKSFRCRRFVCAVDFDDVVLNAQLFPVAYFVSRGPVVLDINFQKRNLLDVWIQARLHRVMWAALRFYLTKK